MIISIAHSNAMRKNLGATRASIVRTSWPRKRMASWMMPFVTSKITRSSSPLHQSGHIQPLYTRPRPQGKVLRPHSASLPQQSGTRLVFCSLSCPILTCLRSTSCLIRGFLPQLLLQTLETLSDFSLSLLELAITDSRLLNSTSSKG